MKRFVTLVLLFVAIIGHSQKALLGTLVLQENFIQLHHTTETDSTKSTTHHKPGQFPTFSLSYLKQGEKGHYNRYFISAWRYTEIEDFKTTIINNATAYIEGGGMKLYSGRLGYARGIALLKKNPKRFLFLETELSAGFQHDSFLPEENQKYSRTVWAAYARLGANLVIQFNYEKGFLRLMALLPALQVNSEHFRIQDFYEPSLVDETNKTYLKTDAITQKGFEVGGGYYFSK